MTRGKEAELSCEQIVETITDYIEGRLDPELVARFEAHLAECPYCVTYVAQMRATIRTLGRIDPERLSERSRADLLSVFRDLNAD